MADLEREYNRQALELALQSADVLPAETVRAIRLALSVQDSHGSASCEELRAQLGPNWVIARRTSRLVSRYGDDVNAISLKQYSEAERAGIESRFPRPKAA